MANNKRMSFQLGAILIAFSSEIAIAAENESTRSTITTWPLVLFVVLLVVFRKQLFSEATPELPDSHAHEEPSVVEAPVAETTPKPAPAAKKAVKEKTSKKKVAKASTAKSSSKNKSIDLKDDSEQCQASTAKGSRCKRTTNLEDTSIKINDTTYQLTVCKQHNTDTMKPYSKLLK